MTVNDTALTNATGLTNTTTSTSRLEARDPVDTLDLTSCPGATCWTDAR